MSGAPLSLAAVVVHYRTPDLLSRCLPGLRSFDEVVVVDNASGDGTPDLVRRAFPWARLVEADVNRGFGSGANLGARATTADAVLVLNPDSLCPPELPERIREALARRPRLWVGGCRLEAPDGTALASGRRFYTPLSLLTRRLRPGSRSARRHTMAGWDRATERAVDWVSGNSMVVRRSAFDALGGFDERYFMYFEDVDLCLRAWRAGGEVWYLAGAHLVHEERRASARGLNRALLWHLRSYLRFLSKWRRLALRTPSYGDRSSILPP